MAVSIASSAPDGVSADSAETRNAAFRSQNGGVKRETQRRLTTETRNAGLGLWLLKGSG